MCSKRTSFRIRNFQVSKFHISIRDATIVFAAFRNSKAEIYEMRFSRTLPLNAAVIVSDHASRLGEKFRQQAQA